MSTVRSSFFLASLAVVSFAHTQACQEAKTTEEVETDQIEDLLRQVASGVLVPQLQIFQDDLALLETELNSLSENPSSEQRSRTQSQWVAVMKSWQKLEMMQFGPAGNSLKVTAGEDIRDEIYSWPSINRCRVDQKTASEEYSNDNFFVENLVHAYGLDALEHLLFSGSDPACPSQVSPVSDGLWQELGEDAISSHRTQYALVTVKDIQNRNQELINLWSEQEENFSATFISGDTPYHSATESLNDVFRALFYLETHTKDKKLAHPLGLKDCQEETCVEDLEGVLSLSSLDSIIGNLEGFEIVFTGADGYGFDDYLIDLGHADLSQQVIQNLEDAIDYGYSLQVPLKDGIIEDIDSVMELHTRIAKITTQLKNELPIVLTLEVPVETLGDND